MTKEHVSTIDQPVLTLEELVQRHLAQAKLKLVLETNLNTLQKDMLATDKQIFDIVNKTKSKHVIAGIYDVAIQVVLKDTPGKTTYKYKEILSTIEANYELDVKWLKRVYTKYSTVSKPETIRISSLIISEIKNRNV